MLQVISEEKSFRITPEEIYNNMQPWEKANETREAVANALRSMFKAVEGWLVTVGGHHVALHNPVTGSRIAMVTGDSQDFN